MSNIVEHDDRRGYLYRHIRLDKDEVFYIGIGFDYKESRPYSKFARNKHWKNIVALTNYEVEILFRDLPKDILVEKEKEFIALYGRRDLKEGTLVNMTDGGDGIVRCKFKNTKGWASIKSDKEKYRIWCHNMQKPFLITVKEPNHPEYHIECCNRDDFVLKTKLSIGYINILKDVGEKVITNIKSNHKHSFPIGTIIKYEKLDKNKLKYPKQVKTGCEKLRRPFSVIVKDENSCIIDKIYCESNTDAESKIKMTERTIKKLKRHGRHIISNISSRTKHPFKVGHQLEIEKPDEKY